MNLPLRDQLTRTAQSFAGLSDADVARLQEKNFAVYRGKVREVIDLKNGRLGLLHSDRLSAFDRAIGFVPYKGVILTHLSAFWFDALARQGIKNHLVHKASDRLLIVQKTLPYKIEVVIRGFLAGSLLRAYEKGERVFCGVSLPDGLKPYAKLPRPIITPTTKAEVYQHDENISAEELVKQGLCSDSEWRTIERVSQEIFAFGSRHLEARGWLLADTKYEFGRLPSGEIVVIDEVHTPDSSRFWRATTYAAKVAQGEAPEMLDKEVIRRYLIDKGFSGHGPVPDIPAEKFRELGLVYLDAAETITDAKIMIADKEPELLHLLA